MHASAAILTLMVQCPPAAACLENHALYVVAGDPARAELIFEAAIAGRSRFEALWAVEPGPTVVVEDIARFPGIAEQFEENGYAVRAWISPHAFRAQLSDQMRLVLGAALAGRPEADIETALAHNVDRIVAGSATTRHEAGVIAHELGHTWLITEFDWKGEGAQDNATYGAAAAPDWLDEVAATSLETPGLNAERWSMFCELDSENWSAEFENYFLTDHPILAASAALSPAQAARAPTVQPAADALAANPSGRSETRVAVLPAENFGGPQRVMSPDYFYGMSRVFLDYVSSRVSTGAPLNHLAVRISQGGDLDGWLADQHFGLPSSVPALSEDIADFAGRVCSS